MEALPDDLRSLYEEFGRAAEMAQVMEVEAGNVALVFVTLTVDPQKPITNEQRKFYRAVVDDVDRRTFGNLLKQIRSVVQIDKSIEDIVNDALEKRNYLTHRFFRTHNFAIHSEEGRKAMRAEIDEIHTAFNLAHATLSGMTHTF
jgi:hypothetical protein